MRADTVSARQIDRWIHANIGVLHENAGFTLTTLLGDAVAPHGGQIGLSSLVQIADLCHIQEQTIRTAVFRVGGDGYSSTRVGRRSDVGLSEDHGPHHNQCLYRVYAETNPKWAGQWEIVSISPTLVRETTQVSKLMRELKADGYGVLSDRTLIRPYLLPASKIGTKMVVSPEFRDALFVFLTQEAPTQASNIDELVSFAWNLDDLSGRYKSFLDRFEPLLDLLWGAKSMDPPNAFIARTCLIHDFRKLVMDSPTLPASLAAECDYFRRARYVVRELYDLLAHPSEAYVSQVLETSDGSRPGLRKWFYDRFGGITPLG